MNTPPGQDPEFLSSNDSLPQRQVSVPGNTDTRGQLSLKDRFRFFLINRAYAPGTVKRYTAVASRFMEFTGYSTPSTGSTDEIERFNREVILKPCRSQSSQEELLQALRIFLNDFLKKKIVFPRLEKPRKKPVVPVTVTRSEAEELYHCVNSLKKKLMIVLVSAVKLKIREALDMKREHVEMESAMLIVAGNPHSAERKIPLMPETLHLIKRYLDQYKPDHYLFEAKPGKNNSARSAQLVLVEAVEKSGLKKKITYATLQRSPEVFIPDPG